MICALSTVSAPNAGSLSLLDSHARALVTALRGWRLGAQRGGLAMASAATTQAGLPESAALPLASALGLLEALAHDRQFAARPLDHPFLSADERRFVDIVTALGQNRLAEADRLLTVWVPSPLGRSLLLISLTDLALAWNRTADLLALAAD